MAETIGPLLSFKEKYLERVLSGAKRVTIRLGVLRPRFQLVYIACCGMLFGEAVITKVEYLRLKDLTPDILREEGFRDLDEALAELKALYPKIELDDLVSVVRFSLIRRYDKPISISTIKRP
ncbi:MAG: ASCH domain-containing protein [Thermoproteus sp.]